jgi:hypothetical protein
MEQGLGKPPFSLTPSLSMADSAEMYDTIYLLSFHEVRRFGGLTSEFAQCFEEK